MSSSKETGGNFRFVDKGSSTYLPPMKAKKKGFFKKLFGR